MSLCRYGHRRADFGGRALPSPLTLRVVALTAFATIASCTLDSSPRTDPNRPPPVAGSGDKPSTSGTTTSSVMRGLDGSVRDADIRVATGQQQSAMDDDAGAPSQPQNSSTDAGSMPDSSTEPTTPPPTMQEPAQMTVMKDVDPECTRMRLREKADAYLKAMNTGDTMPLRLHPSFRYTENGRDEQLGAGAFLRRAQSQFARHVLDESRCGTITQAVMNGVTGRFSFGVRLRYIDGQLLEAEAQVVPEALADTDLNAVIPIGTDPWVSEVPSDVRMPRTKLFEFAQRYFDSVSGSATVPPSAPDCKRRQNGLPLGDGSCARPPGMVRFEQQRFELADELNGIVTATVLYQNHIGVYLIKMFNDTVQNIEVIGGATSMSTGW